MDVSTQKLNTDKPAILVVTQLFPENDRSFLGSFVVEQLRALSKWFRFVIVVGRPVSILTGQFMSSTSHHRIRDSDVIFVKTAANVKVLAKTIIRLGNAKEKVQANLKDRLARMMLPVCQRLHDENHFKLVHGHEVFVGDEAAAIGQSLNIPSIVSIHGLYEYHLELFGQTAMENVLCNLRNASQLIGVSQKVMCCYQPIVGNGPVTWKLIPNGVFHHPAGDLSEMWKMRLRDRELILAAGFLVPGKRFDMAVKCVANVRQRTGKEFVLVILGQGPERRRLQELVLNLKLQDQVFLAGAVSPAEINCWYGRSAFLFHPSIVDSFSMVCLEAMSFGKPIICTSSIGMADIIDSGEEGFLVKPDSLEELSQAMETLLTDRGMRKTMGAKAYRRSLEFSWSRVGPELKHVYETLIGKQND